MERTGARGAGAYYLMCERRWVYHLLMAAAGIFGAYTYLLRGGVFCNAQTGNVVLMGMALGAGDWRGALYYLIPICAYLLGAFVSELLPNPSSTASPSAGTRCSSPWRCSSSRRWGCCRTMRRCRSRR